MRLILSRSLYVGTIILYLLFWFWFWCSSSIVIWNWNKSYQFKGKHVESKSKLLIETFQRAIAESYQKDGVSHCLWWSTTVFDGGFRQVEFSDIPICFFLIQYNARLTWLGVFLWNCCFYLLQKMCWVLKE